MLNISLENLTWHRFTEYIQLHHINKNTEYVSHLVNAIKIINAQVHERTIETYHQRTLYIQSTGSAENETKFRTIIGYNNE